MKRTSIFRILCSVTLVLWVLLTMTAHSQEKSDTQRQKAIFAELAGSSANIFSANFDMRLNKGQSNGLGIRIGVGGGSTSDDYILGEGSIKTKMFSVPLEVNYLLGKKRFLFEIGYALTYISIKEVSTFKLLDMYEKTIESEDLLVSYVPVGFRWNPAKNGFMLKLNIGPLINFSAPNLGSDNTVNIWGGLAVGYTFY